MADVRPSHLTLWKTHGARNDFLITEAAPEALAGDVDGLRALAQALCHRTASLGADGLVFLRRLPDSAGNGTAAPLEVLVVNSDGSLAGTCGNALRCVGLHAALSGWWDGDSPLDVMRLVPLFFMGDAGRASLRADEGAMADFVPFARLLGLRERLEWQAEVDVGMGAPRLVKEVVLPPESLSLLGAEAGGSESHVAGDSEEGPSCVRAFHVELSNPHLVLLADGMGALPATEHERLGRIAQGDRFRSSLPGVPLANIGFVSPAGAGPAGTFDLVVYERGAGLTQCCGSGATAARLALEAAGTVPPARPWVPFRMPGGLVSIGRGEKDSLVLRGPAERIALCELALRRL